MRHNQNRRSRGRSRKGPNPLARSYESNGPDVKVRGTAIHIAEKYMTLARDALSSGDTISAENYFQHAEHYNRIVMAAQAQFQQERQAQFRDGMMDDGEDDDRQMNGRGPDFNGDGGRLDDDRFEGGEREEVRGYVPRLRNEQQGRFDRRDRMERGPRPDRGERFERGEPYERAEPVGRSEPAIEEAVEAAPAVEAPPAEAAPAPERRPRRRRPPRSEDTAEQGAAADADSTNDGAAALAAFPK
jgi:hypothetical protein